MSDAFCTTWNIRRMHIRAVVMEQFLQGVDPDKYKLCLYRNTKYGAEVYALIPVAQFPMKLEDAMLVGHPTIIFLPAELT